MNEPTPPSRKVIIPSLRGKLTRDGKWSEPDIFYIMEKWLERHPEFRGREREFRISRGRFRSPEGFPTEVVRVTAEFGSDLADYDHARDRDLYEYWLAGDD